MLDIIKAYAVNNLCYKAAKKMTPKGIVVHSTGANNPTLKRYVDAPNEVGVNRYGNHWNVAKPGGRSVCVHAFIGLDINNDVRVAELLPLNICCWGVGAIPYDKNGKELSSSNNPNFHHFGPSYNYDPAYIQFEICEDGLTDKTYYRKAFDMAIEYCAELCKKYNIDVSNIVGHCEAYRRGYGSNHSDPEHWMKKHGETMADFRSAVSAILKTNNEKTENKTETPSVQNSSATVTTTDFHKGDLVSIAKNATYYSGKNVPSWVKSQKWYIKEEPKGDRVVIDKNEKGTNSICSPIHNKYLTLVKASNKGTSSTVKTEAVSNCPYLVKVTANSLTIRKGAGTNSAKVGTITDKGTYTIVEERKGTGASMWGKLKSGAGWISLDYVKKV